MRQMEPKHKSHSCWADRYKRRQPGKDGGNRLNTNSEPRKTTLDLKNIFGWSPVRKIARIAKAGAQGLSSGAEPKKLRSHLSQVRKFGPGSGKKRELNKRSVGGRQRKEENHWVFKKKGMSGTMRPLLGQP